MLRINGYQEIMNWTNIEDALPQENSIVWLKFRVTRDIRKAEYKKGNFYEIVDIVPAMGGGKLKYSNINSWSYERPEVSDIKVAFNFELSEKQPVDVSNFR